MAKEFLVRLSDAEEKKAIDSGLDNRTVELKMLAQLFEIAAAREKDHRKRNCIIDVLEQIENVDDESKGIKLTKDDFDRLDAGMKIACDSPGGMPGGWLKQARSVLRQLEQPEEVAE